MDVVCRQPVLNSHASTAQDLHQTARREHEKRAQEHLAQQQHLQSIREHQEEYWQHVDLAVTRGSGTGYDEATQLLSELRESSNQFQEPQVFHARFRTWVGSHLRRPALIKRLQAGNFPLPEV